MTGFYMIETSVMKELNSKPNRGVFKTLLDISDDGFLQKLLTAFTANYFLKKAPSQNFERVLNTPLSNVYLCVKHGNFLTRKLGEITVIYAVYTLSNGKIPVKSQQKLCQTYARGSCFNKNFKLLKQGFIVRNSHGPQVDNI